MQNASLLEDIIQQIELYSNKNKLNHRFVGGVSFGGLVNNNTHAEIVIDTKTIKLFHHNRETTVRKDKTIRDIDLILFCDNKEKINAFKQFIEKLKEKNGHTRNFPDISFEPTIYPLFGKRNPFSQFVTSLEVDKKNNLFLTFDEIMQEISWQSIEPWTVMLTDGAQFTVRNPIADYYAYLFRSPAGPKPKDLRKIFYLKKLAEQVILAGKNHTPAIDYMSSEYYGSWQEYITQLQKTTSPIIKAKKIWLRLYWQTIGTLFAHTLSRYGNNFTGIK